MSVPSDFADSMSALCIESPNIFEFDFDDEEMQDISFPSVAEILSLMPDTDIATMRQTMRLKTGPEPSGPAATEPILIASSVTTQHGKLLYELLQTQAYMVMGLKVAFDYVDAGYVRVKGLPVTSFTSTATFLQNGVTIKTLETSPACYTKKHAKELASGIAYEYLLSDPEELRGLQPSPNGSEVSSSTGSVDAPIETVNWVGMLHGTRHSSIYANSPPC